MPRKAELSEAAAILGAKGGRAGKGKSKRRDVDYAALGAKGGAAGKGKKKPRKRRGRPPKEKP